MQLWPVLLWPKPKARQQHIVLNNNNINLAHVTKSRTIVFCHNASSFKWLWVFTINAWLLITIVKGSTTAASSLASPPLATAANYQGVRANANTDVVAALTGLSNGYAAATNYIKNYYHVREPEDNENIQTSSTLLPMQYQQQQQQLQQQQLQQLPTTNNAGIRTELQKGNTDSNAGIVGRGFMDLYSNNYGNSIVARGAGGVGYGGDGGGTSFYGDAFNIHKNGFVPTTFTPAGQHYASSLASLQAANNNINAKQHHVPASSLHTETNKNDLQQNRQQYAMEHNNGNVNSNSIAAGNDNSKSQQHSLFRRLPNYTDHFNGGGSGTNNENASRDIIPNYTLAYADEGKQSAILQNFYNEQQQQYNGEHDIAADIKQQHRQQIFANYFSPTGYDVENPAKYYTFNNNYQTNVYQPEQQGEQQQQYEQPFKLETLTANSAKTMAPATYYQTHIQHKNDNDNKEQQQQQQQLQQYYYKAKDNYQEWQQQQQQQQNQITSNYQQKQSAHIQHQRHLLQEPETAETLHISARLKKPSTHSSTSSSTKHKSKRSDNTEQHSYNNNANNQNYNPMHRVIPVNEIDTESETDFDNTMQLEQLQQQLQQQQQQFIQLQHQLIEHDQQLQIQKQMSQTPPPTLPPITHTVHHNAQSLQALAGTPLSKHTQVIKSIPIQQHYQVHVPYRQNVAVEVPESVIATVSKPVPIEIPVTRTVAVPNIQEVKIPVEKLKPFPVERPIPYIVEKRVPYAVEKQIAKPVYYPVPIKVPIVHTVVHKLHHAGGYYNQPHGHAQSHQSFHLPHTVYRTSHGHGHGHVYNNGGHGHHTHHYAGNY